MAARMLSPSTSSPGSPCFNEAASISTKPPPLIIRPSPAVASSGVASPPTNAPLMSKEWVIPPRPKPGRKPATDTPPTKRKAQNRAAQRAFRERRAARVGELEEQIKQMEEEDEKEQTELRSEIERLESMVEHYREDLTRWIEKCRGLERDLMEARTGGQLNATDAVPLPSRTSRTTKPISQQEGDATVGCGKCSLETSCQCLDEAFNVMSAAANRDASAEQRHEKRLRSPSIEPSDKRLKIEPPEVLEIDFTAVFASKPRPEAQKVAAAAVSPSSAVADPCGFCSDGTPCICAEMAADALHTTTHAITNTNSHSHSHSNSIENHAPRILQQLSQFTPPPSEHDVSISMSTSQAQTQPQHQPQPSITCGSGVDPGTCTQCQADPNSTLFCKSLAASCMQGTAPLVPPTQASGCCVGNANASGGGGGGCCKIQPASSATVKRPARQQQQQTFSSTSTTTNISTTTSPPQATITLTCADAYTTLSRHPGYSRASEELASWMPKLRANERHAARTALERGRPTLEIDVANVMTVLKEFDRRFVDRQS